MQGICTRRQISKSSVYMMVRMLEPSVIASPYFGIHQGLYYTAWAVQRCGSSLYVKDSCLYALSANYSSSNYLIDIENLIKLSTHQCAHGA